MTPSNVQTCHPLRDISDFLDNKGWNFEKFQEAILEEVVH